MFMGRDFLKRKAEGRSFPVMVLTAGVAVSLILAVLSLRESGTGKAGLLPRNGIGEGAYEQKLIADVEGYGKIPLTVTVEERRLTKAEIRKELKRAADLLPGILQGENESLQKVTKELKFVEAVPGTIVEVRWQTEAWDYFSADMTRRKDVRLTEPVQVLFLAVLSCQGEEQNLPVEAMLFPVEETAADRLAARIAQRSEESAEEESLCLPEECDGMTISWKKPADITFLYVLFLALSAAVLLRLGQKRDEERKQQEEKEELERAYAELVSKFTMLLSAGLSIRNAWERITSLYQEHPARKQILYRELCRSLRELQQGIAETEVYERFGARTGLIHYKKLMALFISDKRRGSIPLLEALEKEMLEAWEEKKRQTRQRGEKAETKLLVPMLGMLSVVFMIILIPAFLSFRI